MSLVEAPTRPSMSETGAADQTPQASVVTPEPESQPQPQIDIKPTFRDKLRPFVKPAARVLAAAAFLAFANQVRGLPNSPDPGQRADSQAGLNIPNPLEPGTAGAQGSNRINFPMIGKDSTPTPTPAPTETPKPMSEIAKWYSEKAQEVPGTRLTKTVNGKECLLKSFVESDTNYEFRWRANFPESIINVTNYMCEDEIAQGFDELVIGAFASIDNVPAGIPFYEIRTRQTTGEMKSRGFFAHILFEVNGKKIRMAAYAPPRGGISLNDAEVVGGASSSTALQLVYVSAAGETPPRDVTVAQQARMDLIDQDYVNMVKLFPKQAA